MPPDVVALLDLFFVLFCCLLLFVVVVVVFGQGNPWTHPNGKKLRLDTIQYVTWHRMAWYATKLNGCSETKKVNKSDGKTTTTTTRPMVSRHAFPYDAAIR